jgi:hydroxyacylglutathione hydrolase
MQIHYFERLYPSANMALIPGSRPVLIDSGFGYDQTETVELVRGAGVDPHDLALLVNTHAHCDHSGGNHYLQQRFGVTIAAHRWDGIPINRRDPEACTAAWLGQPIEAYHVDRFLREGDRIDTGAYTIRVLHTPGHTLAHITLLIEEARVLICGDAFHSDDAAWINIFREGAGAIDRAIESLDRLAGLRLNGSFSGHSPYTADPYQAIDAARRRYERWIDEPQRLAWHACKRIFTYILMVYNGMHRTEIGPYLLGCPWFQDYSRHIFRLQPDEFIEPLLAELVRANAAAWDGERMVALAPHTPPPADWPPPDADWVMPLNGRTGARVAG